eukprot:4725466-Amphidinium_carterae.1
MGGLEIVMVCGVDENNGLMRDHKDAIESYDVADAVDLACTVSYTATVGKLAWSFPQARRRRQSCPPSTRKWIAASQERARPLLGS